MLGYLALTVSFLTVSSSSVRAEAPCDIFSTATTRCVAAHSTIRSMYSTYHGPLYQVKRLSDNALFDVKTLPTSGYADASSQDAFCGSSDCVIHRIYDQSPMQNHLDIAPPGEAHPERDTPANATADKLSVGGHQVYSAYFEGGMGYRIDNTTGIAKGDEAETIYMVTSGKHYNDRCCFDYGNAEVDNNDDGAGTMEALYFGNATGGLNHGGAGNGPWIMADMENALWGANVIQSNEESISHEYVTAMIKCDSAKSIPLPPSPPRTTPGPANITKHHDICPGTGDLSNFQTNDIDKCNVECFNTQDCTAYVLRKATCYLKSCVGPIVSSSNAILGQIIGRQNGGGHWEIWGGDAQSGALKSYWSGPRAPGYSPMKKQGAIILGIGGDNSDRAVGTFYEGAMVSGFTSSVTDAKVQQNIVAAGYGK